MPKQKQKIKELPDGTHIDQETGQVVKESDIFNRKKILKTIVIMPNGVKRKRVQQDFSNCVSRTDINGAEETDLNYLIQKYSPHELANYLAMKGQQRRMVTGLDLTKEPSRQGAMNEVYRLQQLFQELNPEIQKQFKNVHEFLKFTDNPKNVDKLIKFGLVSKVELEDLKPELKGQAPEEPIAPETKK